MASDAKGRAILESVVKAYEDMSSYDDTGSVTVGATTTIHFTTRFRRGSLFEFAYDELQEDGTFQPRGRVGWKDGQLSFWTALEPPTGTPTISSLKHAIAALTGVSKGTAHAVASLLLHREVGGALPTELREPILLSEEVVDGSACYCVRGEREIARSALQAAAARGVTLEASQANSLFVDKSLFLIRRIVLHAQRPQTIQYRPSS